MIIYIYINKYCIYRLCMQNLLDDDKSSGLMTPLRSGSSPYQKIHSSLATFNDNGGGIGAATGVRPANGSKMGPVAPGVCELG